MSVMGVGIGRLALASIVAGLTAAIFEMIFVLPIQGLLGASPAVVFQSIASGLLGKAAFHDGLYAVMIGLGVHGLVSLVSAAAFVLAAARWPSLLKRTLVSGLACGLIAYVVMNFVVIPFSAIGFRSPKLGWLWLISFSVHLFAFGLPIALVSRLLLSSAVPPSTPDTAQTP